MRRQPDDPGIDQLARDMRQQETGALFWFCVWIVALGIVLLAWFVPVSVAKADDFRTDERADISLCRGFIDTNCSCSHRSCWQPQPGEFTSLGDGRWKQNATGQVKQQTGWSRDGTFIACAWRSGTVPGVMFHVGRGNPLSCLYVPLPAS